MTEEVTIKLNDETILLFATQRVYASTEAMNTAAKAGDMDAFVKAARELKEAADTVVRTLDAMTTRKEGT